MKAPPRSIQLVIGIGVGALAFGLTTALLAPEPGLMETAPSEVIGYWETDDERYVDRGFEILEAQFRLWVGPDEVLPYPIRSVRVERLDSLVTYEIIYGVPGGEDRHEMTVGPAGEAVTRQPAQVRWTRR